MKEKLQEALGTLGTILYMLIRLIVCVLPFVMIHKGFLLTALFIAIETFIPTSSAVFWIWGLVCAVTGQQDILAIIYYIAAVIVFLPFITTTIRTLLDSFRKRG